MFFRTDIKDFTIFSFLLYQTLRKKVFSQHFFPFFLSQSHHFLPSLLGSTFLGSTPGSELSVEERNLLSVAYKNVIGSLRAAWRIVSSIEQKEESRKNEEHVVLVKDYRSKVESELSDVCASILQLLDSNLIPSASASESKVFYLKMKGDYHRYLAEFKVGDERKAAAEDTMLAYRAAQVACLKNDFLGHFDVFNPFLRYTEAICSFLAARTTELETAAYPALDELTAKISSRNLDRVRKLKSAMTRLTARVQKVRDELEQLLDDDDDMTDLYLSRKMSSSSPVSGSGPANWFPASPTIGSKISRASRASVATVRGDEDDIEELEMLLEAYFMQIDGTLNKLTTLREYIDDTEDYINIQLELFLSSGTVCLSIYSLVSAIFGMNIPYTWNDDHGYMFKWVVIVAGFASAVLFITIIYYAR
ncbi:hypothetical protein IC582_023970 [Cucumis melo]